MKLAWPALFVIACGTSASQIDGGDDLGTDAATSACTIAGTIAAGVALTNEPLPTATRDLAPVCAPLALGPELTFSTTIPADERLIVRATPNGTELDLVLRVLTSCAASSCVNAADDGTQGAPEVVSYRNATSDAATIHVAVASVRDTTTDTFDLDAWLRSPPANADCARATSVTSGSALATEDGEDATTPPSTACEASSTGNALYYAVTIPAGATLTTVATPLGSWDVVLRLVATCAATSCLASVDDAGRAGKETMTYANTSTTEATAIIVVGAFGSTGPFDLAVTVQ